MKTTYISTRGGCEPLGFSDVVMTGLARDGGLFLPSATPDARPHLAGWRRLSYPDLAFEIMRLYVDLPDTDLRTLIEKSYSGFGHPEVAPVVSPSPGLNILELFHGPTLAFKDLALQFLGNLFEYIIARTERKLNLLVATSGDTGSAAIHGVKGRKGMRIFVLYPNGGISSVQERQMTTVPDDNVFCIAVDGNFDDCQDIVKKLFCDLDFRDRHALGAVNSINWARLLAQVVYYFYAAFRMMDRFEVERVRFSVPTGNFGNIFAGYIAARMGLPVGLLVLACNENDILARFFETGVYRRGGLMKTLSPSMDIQVASNFERYIYYLADEDPSAVCKLMKQFSETGQLEIDIGRTRREHKLIAAGSGNARASLAAIRDCYERTGYILDPHTAVGVHVAGAFYDPVEPTVCLATAHPAKFGEAIRKATGRDIARHEILDGLDDLPQRRAVLPASGEAVRAYIESAIGGG